MSVLSLKIQQKLDMMSTKFAALLPERLERIKESADRVLNGERCGIQQFHLLVHKLGGAGATFGFVALSRIAKDIEHLLYSFINAKGELKSEDLEQISTLLQELEAQCEHGMKKVNTLSSDGDLEETLLEPVEDKPPTDKEKKTIYLFDHKRGVFQDLKEQLEIFGFTTIDVTTFSELETIEGWNRNRLVIIDTTALNEIEGAEIRLATLKSARKNRLKIVFISEKNDFDIRLQAVRAGGDDFFIAPVEIGRLIDTIDKLTERIEQEPYHVLVVDDDPEQVSYHAHVLQQAGMITSVATDPKHVVKVLVESKPEIILVDMYMPGCSGGELAAIIRQQPAFVSIPIVFLSIENSVDIQMDAIQSGGDDFLVKPIKEEHLISSISNRIERTRGMRYLMERDSLTGLLNHTNLKEQLSREVLRSQRTNTEICFAMIDVDLFKSVNDTYGHLTGDNVLKGLARLLQERLRKTDIIGRYGGEEFGAILLNTNTEHAERIMNEIRDNFSHMKQYSDSQEFHVAFSCGIASYKDFGEPAELNEAADRALYEAKETGRNKVVVAKKQR